MNLNPKAKAHPSGKAGCKSFGRQLLGSVIGLAGLFAAATSAQAGVTYIGDAVLSGSGTDLSGLPPTILEDGKSPQNALNGIGSGLAYAGGNLFYALEDRGPNKVAYSGGTAVDNTTSYPNRYQQFTINVTPVLASLSGGVYTSYNVNMANVGTTLLKNAQGVQYLGISTAFSTNPAVENHRLDCEAIRVAPDGTVWISDEYGPYILHFNRQGQEIGSLPLPAGFQITNPAATLTAETATNTSGRTTNKGMEGLALTPDGKTLVGMMQGPLIQDGGSNGTNVRILVYDLTNQSAPPKQYLYQLDSAATPISELLAINSHEFLVDERDGVTGAAGIKKLYKIDLNQATPPTDLTTSAEAGTTSSNGLPTTGTPGDVVPLQKTLFANIGQILNDAQTGGQNVFSTVSGTTAILPDKLEGYSWGPDLADGRHLLLATNDNDFAQNGSTPVAGFPNYVFAFAVDDADVDHALVQPSFLPEAVKSIDHIVVVYQENWTFDGLYSAFPGANGIANASATSLNQLNKLTGNPLSTELGSGSYNDQSNTIVVNNPPAPLSSVSTVLDSHFISSGTTKINTLVPYLLTDPSLNLGIDPTYITGDIYHRYWQEQYQINHGNNNLFVSWSDNPGLVMSHFDATYLPEGILAQQYTICDNYFHSAFGGSFLNHQFLIAARAPVYPNAATVNSGALATLDGNGVLSLNGSGKLVHDGSITPIGGVTFVNPTGTFDNNYVVNTSFSVNMATNTTSFPGGVAPASLIPSQNDSNPAGPNYIPTIGDLLDNANVSWKWYSGGWNNALASSPSNPAHYGNSGPNNVDSLFQWHHQPFAFFDNYAPFVSQAAYNSNPGAGPLNPRSAAHLQDETQFFADVQSGSLPSVCFIKPVGANNEHPGYAALQTGQAHVASIVQAIQANPSLWAHTAIIITYDEHGGRWDHVAPPSGDIWGPGARVPCIIISPLAAKGYVDHTQYTTDSILATIEDRFNLDSLNPNRDAVANNLFGSFTTLDIARGGTVLNRRTNSATQVVTITNRSAAPVTGPIQLVLDNPSTTLSNKTGVTTVNSPLGSPYITVSAGDLAAGASVTVTLQWAIPGSGGVTYSARTVTGTVTP